VPELLLQVVALRLQLVELLMLSILLPVRLSPLSIQMQLVMQY
jgi:hypothetical protein